MLSQVLQSWLEHLHRRCDFFGTGANHDPDDMQREKCCMFMMWMLRKKGEAGSRTRSSADSKLKGYSPTLLRPILHVQKRPQGELRTAQKRPL